MNKIARLSLQILTLVVLLSGPVAPAMAASTVVALSPAAGSVAAGQTLVVNVTVADVTALFGAEFHLTFDAGRLEVVDADPATEGLQVAKGSFLSNDFVAQNVANNTAGTVDFGVSQMSPHGPVSGTGVLATITFRGKAAGSAAVTFSSVLLADSGGTQISATSQNGSVTVTGGATPAPTTAAPTATTTATATATTPAPSGCTIQGYHVVRAGETLYAIGRAYATLPSKIAACNGIVNVSRIYVGTRLAIPVAPWSPIPAGPVAAQQFTPGGTVVTPVPVTPTPVPGCRYYHTVARGDTLTAIAVRYGASVWAIGRANSIYNLNLIYPGQVLCIP